MSLVRIQNRGKNLWLDEKEYISLVLQREPLRCINLGNKLRTIVDNFWYVEGFSPAYPELYIPVKPNTTYTFSCQREIIQHDGIPIFEAIMIYSSISTQRLEERATSANLNNGLRIQIFTTPPDARFITLRFNRSLQPHTAIVDYWNFQLEENSLATEHEPPRNDCIEFDTELFGYAGVYDELYPDGTLIKRWQRESITITSGAGTVTKNGTGTCILVADSDGVPYEGTVSGTSMSTSAPDGTYTIIYQLATPEIIDLNYDGELNLYPGENNLILPDFAVASISGSRKYLEG